MCGIVYFLGKVIKNDVLALIVQIVSGAAIYIALSIISKNESYIYLKDYIKARLGREKLSNETEQ